MNAPMREVMSPGAQLTHEDLAVQVLEERMADFERSQRDPAFLWPTIAAVLLSPFLFLFPGAEEATGIPFFPTMISMSVLAFVIVSTTVVFHRYGLKSRVYWIFDFLETSTMQFCIGLVVALSGDGTSFFWTFYLVHLLIAASRPVVRFRDVAPFFFFPCAVAVYLSVKNGFTMNSTFPVVVSAMGGIIMSFVNGLHQRINQLNVSRAALESELTRLRVEQERSRIARDLHDGVTADLSAIAWRADALARENLSAEVESQLKSLGERARAAIEETQSVVWALRTDSLTWEALTEHLRNRCEGARGTEVILQWDHAPPPEMTVPGEVALNVVRSVQEGVRNAVKHAEASRVEVVLDSLKSGAGVSVKIRDNGVGLSAPKGEGEKKAGGLANLEHRTAQHGGSLQIRSQEVGAEISMTFFRERPL